jgi:5-methyltetrahydrofolate--homocysteine methyltransferase
LTRTEAFLAKVHSGQALVADGATGTMHQRLGLPAGMAPEVWVLEQPERVRALHRAYIEAGADLILTCSFGGTHYRLESHGLADRVVELNRRAAELAREVAGDGILVAGDMGPTGQLLAPLGAATPEQIADAYAAQTTGLAAGGADFLLIETLSDLGEALAAIEGARRVTDLPIICTFSFDTHGRTMMGIKPELAATKIGPLVEGVGANCGKDPAEYIGFMDTMKHALREAGLDAILWAKPNAGLPRLVDDEVVYDATPEYMGRIALQLREAGAQVIGGCCGTTPEHVAAIVAALKCPSKTEER